VRRFLSYRRLCHPLRLSEDWSGFRFVELNGLYLSEGNGFWLCRLGFDVREVRRLFCDDRLV
jgi:hypothetical protein